MERATGDIGHDFERRKAKYEYESLSATATEAQPTAIHLETPHFISE